MEASMNVGIRPVERPQAPSAGEGVGRRGDGGGSSAAFSPKTNVAIQNAVDDMAGILSKIASNQTDAVEKMPADLQKLIQNVMKQAFSLEETLAQGLGSTLESQRFSMEQLSSFSRMLTQMGKLMDRGMTMEVSDTMQALLTNLKNLASAEQGAALEPVLLTKAAFELLDGKPFAELPRDVQQLLLTMQPQGMVQPLPAGEGSATNFLKQLVQYFMPRPTGDGSGAQPQANPPGQAAAQGQQGQPMAQNPAGQNANAATQPNAAATQPGQTANAPAGGNPAAGQNAPLNANTMANNQPSGQANLTSQNQLTSQNAANGQNLTSQSAPQSGGQPAQANLPGLSANPAGQAAGGTAGNISAGAGQTASQAQGPGQGNTALGNTVQQSGGNQPAVSNSQTGPLQDVRANLGQGMARESMAQAEVVQRPQQTAMQQAKNQLMNQVMENTPQTMNVMRDLAQLLLKDGNLTQKDALLMQSFVNGKEALLSAKETQQLQQLIRLCQANVPATIQQAALQQNIPDLPRLWAFMQLCDMTYTRNMTARQLKKAGKDVAAFVLSMRGSMEGDNSIVPGQRSLNFMLPMYMGEESTYPAYIHVYDEKQPDPETGEMKKETWLRLCVLTDNIGAVELTCRVYHENQLDMRLFFSNTETANEFRSQVDALRSSLRDSSLKLKELKVGAVGERRFM